MINTPNYPDYVSGAASVTSATTTILQLFFGTDTLKFAVTSDAPLAKQKQREFGRNSTFSRFLRRVQASW